MKKNVPLDMNGQRTLNFNPHVINAWNCHFEKRILDVLVFLCGEEINTVAQYSNFTIFKIAITTKDIFRNTGQYTLSFKRCNHSFNLNEGINQTGINVNNWIINKYSSFNFVYLCNRRSIMPEEMFATVHVKVPLLQG